MFAKCSASFPFTPLLWVVVTGCALVWGCTGGKVAAPGSMFQPPSVLAAEGDWDDLAASVQVGAEQSEMVVVKQTCAGNDQTPARFELRTNLNEPVVVEASRIAGASAASGTMSLRAGVGRFGDDARERALLAAIARRLHDLRGVEFAPIRE